MELTLCGWDGRSDIPKLFLANRILCEMDTYLFWNIYIFFEKMTPRREVLLWNLNIIKFQNLSLSVTKWATIRRKKKTHVWQSAHYSVTDIIFVFLQWNSFFLSERERVSIMLVYRLIRSITCNRVARIQVHGIRVHSLSHGYAQRITLSFLPL